MQGHKDTFTCFQISRSINIVNYGLSEMCFHCKLTEGRISTLDNGNVGLKGPKRAGRLVLKDKLAFHG